MYREKRVFGACQRYIEELSYRVVAESGRACDRYHLGKLILQGLKDAPEFTLQIDGSTGESMSFASALERSVQCAHAFKELGLKAGDVIVMMTPNNLNMSIPYYAGLYLGVLVSPIDRLLKIKELKNMYEIAEPKIVFCKSERVKDVQTALDELKLKSKIVTMDVKSENQVNAISLNELLKKYGSNVNVQDFKAADFDPEESIALLMPTSGTTGLPKQTCLTYKNLVINAGQTWCRETKFPSPFKVILVVSPMQWFTCIWNLNMAPIFRSTIVTSAALDIDRDHFYDIVNKYKPNHMIISPTKLATLVGPETKDKCDMSCYELIVCGGSAVSSELLKIVKELAPQVEISKGYGMTEAGGNVFMWGATVDDAVGVPGLHLQYRLIDVDTQEDIFERNKTGELWIKGPSVCKGYYKNAEATKGVFSEDGWLKTGDLLYRDEFNNFFFVDRMKLLFKYMNHQGYYKNAEATKGVFSEDGWLKTGDLLYRDEFNNFFFVDRMKLLFKYMNHQISPVEIQQVIQQHPAVQDVAVTSIADQRGDLPVACVVLKPGASVSAQEIKDIVKDSLTDTKQLRGGVVFMDKLPMTPSTKIDYQRLKKLVLELNRE